MATLKTIAPAAWTTTPEQTINTQFNLWAKFTDFADSQKNNHVLWFFIVLMVHGVFFLPLPAVLMYYFDAPAGVLAITMICFFTNLIATMGGAGIRTALTVFAVSIVLHVLMALVFIL
ncbi:hypothetical protein ABDD95_22155 [Mucilaginibacter sp. PAMB04274]|uniref:hypothetical protein n=1 Tax=Mucilaginibacter sp. PAMB04274 TaxID=3138568 RepID=UPI0031F6E9A6